ncbi:MAG: hypothetical protein LBE82_00960, partial [Chitinophagaceae bacterium]|nr:hypothetical protein [Chitinophagaceae bacterium]
MDYFHASEHLGAFAGNVFKDEKQKWQWCEQQEALLKESQVEEVIKEIETIGKDGYEKEAEALIQYYRNNIDRMDYKRYRQTGCGIIGSGAIE